MPFWPNESKILEPWKAKTTSEVSFAWFCVLCYDKMPGDIVISENRKSRDDDMVAAVCLVCTAGC